MIKIPRIPIIFTVAFLLVATIVCLVNYQLAGTSPPESFALYNFGSIASVAALYALILYLCVKSTEQAKKEQEVLQEKIKSVTNTLNDAQSSLDDAVEKKTFEMSVINGSLNREIAERIQAESEGIKLRECLQAILNSAGDGIFGIDSKGIVTFVNHKASELLGWSREELIGNSHHDLVHHTHESGAHFPVQECPLYMAYKDGNIHFENDDIFWTKNGRSFPVEYTSTPLLDGEDLAGAVVIFKDISQAKRMKKQLELILDSAGEGIFGLDMDGNVTFINRAASIMLGWERKDLLGQSLHDIIHHKHADGSIHLKEDCPIHMTCQDGQVHFKSDDIFWTKDKSSFIVEYNSTPIFEGKKITGAVVVFRDLTAFS